jgi:DeoR family glycerol-3-phosphate regulon repressor
MNRSTLTLRQQNILEQVRSRGFLSVEHLAGQCGVTPQTIRKEINELAARALVQRFHGGVGLQSSLENASYGIRRVLNLAEKQRIARLVAGHIPARASLFINIGTTTEEVARELATRKGLRIITNNLHVAAIFADNEDVEVIVAGGLVRSRDQAVIGELTVEFIRQFKVDIGIIGISGIDADGSLLDFDYREVLVSRAIIANSRRVFLVTDASKFGRDAMVRLGHVSQASDLFIDREAPDGFRAMLAAHEIAVHIAAGD